jgi:hypothetical protein
MKLLSLLLLFICILIGHAHAANSFNSPDILIDSKLDQDWSKILIAKLRIAMKNYGIDDPFNGQFPGALILNENSLGNLLPERSLPLVRNVGKLIGLDFIKTKTKVELIDLAYDIKGFNTNLLSSEKVQNGLIVSTELSAAELLLSAEKLNFSILIPEGKNNKILMNFGVIRPFVKASEERLINLSSRIHIKDIQDAFKFEILNADFNSMAQSLLDHPEDLDFGYESLDIPQVSVKVGDHSLDFSPEKIEKLLRSKHEEIKSIMIAQLVKILRKSTYESFIRIFEKYRLQKDYWMDTNLIKAQIKISEFASQINRNNLEIKIPADFCTQVNFSKFSHECLNHKKTKAPESRINKDLHQNSLNNIQDLVDSGEANFVTSISEDYLSKLLATSYDAGLWKKVLDSAGVDLGPDKVRVVMNKKGNTGTLIMDVLYRPSFMQGLLIGKDLIRFPLVLDVSVRFDHSEEDLQLMVRLNDVDLSDGTLRKGLPEIQVQSGIKDVPRFKNKIIKAIQSKLGQLKEKDVLKLKLPQLNGLGLHNISFISDGSGRMNAIMRVEEVFEPQMLLMLNQFN